MSGTATNKTYSSSTIKKFRRADFRAHVQSLTSVCVTVGIDFKHCAVTYFMIIMMMIMTFMMIMIMTFRQTWTKERSLLTVLCNRTFCLISITVYSKVTVSSRSYKETGNEGLNHPRAVLQCLQPAVTTVCAVHIGKGAR